VTDRTQSGFSCEACEGMCLDAVDGTLTAAEQEVFDRHVAGCVACAEEFSAAKRGAAWMEMLKEQRPEPSERLLQRILAQTSEAAPMLVVHPAYVPEAVARPSAGLWRRLAGAVSFDAAQSHFQPRMAMTAAMAFFSIALTLNLSGVRLSDMRPGAIQRGIADARASATRSFQNMKVVYQVESRVNELRGDDNDDPGGPFVKGDGDKDRNSGKSFVAPEQQAPARQPSPEDEKSKDRQVTPGGRGELVMPGPRLERISDGNDEPETAADAHAPRLQKGASDDDRPNG
jgi:hypothetical protein